ncbi:hypothetical protein, partial [Candidatus Ichthyocystis sparus]|uniref:hypothetical protein n=1 Tax=Candidatus Ichthyocystis sparus TaxID=1561004 RepID=UPI00159EDC88
SPGGTVSSLPPIAGSVPQVRIIRVISKSKASGSGDKATTGEGTASGSGIVAVSPDNAGSSSPIVTETVPQVRIIRVISKSRASGSGINVTSDAASSGGGVVVSPDGTKSSLPSITGSVPQTRVISESKISGDSSKCAEGTGSGSRAIDLTRRLVVSLSRLKCQHELSSQPESSLSPVGTVPQRRVITESKTSGGSSKCVEGTDSGSSAIELTRRLVVSIPRLKLQHELSSQPGSSLSPVGTVPQRRVISKSKTSEGSSKCAEGTESVSSTAALTHSLVISPTQLRPELSSQSESLPNPYPQSETQSRSLLLLEEKYDHPSPRFVKLLSCRDQPAIQLRSVLLLEGEYDQSSSRFVKSLSYRDQPANLSDIVAVSTPDEPPSNYSDFGALVGELSPAPSSPPSVSFAPLSLSPSTSESEPQSQYETQLGSLLPLEYDSELHSPKFVKLFSSYKDQPGNVPVADTVSTFVALPEGDAGSSLPLITDPVAAPNVSGEYFSNISDGVLVSTAEGAASDLGVLEDELLAPAPLSLPPSESVVAADISSAFMPTALAGELSAVVGVVSALRCPEGELILPPHSPSIEPSSSSSSSCLSSSPSESGLDADVSSSSPESPVLTRKFGLTAEVIVSEPGVLVGEPTSASSSEQIIVPITAPSSVSVAAIGEPSTAASSSSSSYFHEHKNIMQFKEPFEVSTTNDVAGPSSSSVSISSIGIAGPSFFVPADVNVPLVSAATDAVAGEYAAVRLPALLNRDLLPVPVPASESNRSTRGGRGGLSSSLQGSAQRRGRKRKRNE